MKTTFLVLASICAITASCGTQTRTLDEGRIEELRLLFEMRRCQFTMDDLGYAISVQYPYLVPDSLPPDVIPAGVPDSLTACPTSLLPYSVDFEPDGITITCPSGHGSTRLDY